MVDWTSSMQQTFEYYIVDPATWKDSKLINNVKSCTISRDSTAETLGSASLNLNESIGECYVRVYLITIQNGVKEKHPLGTFMIQTPSTSFDGKIQNISVDAYTPLIELKENQPELGYSLLEGTNIMELAYQIVREHARAPVVKATNDKTLFSDFISESNDTWLNFLTDFIANAKYIFDLDELGRILFSPKQNLEAMQSIWTYNDDNSSILYPEITFDRDLYGIPNTVEVLYSSGRDYYYSKVVNDDSNSPTSTVSRGREIIYRVTNPTSLGNPTGAMIQEYAEMLLKELSSIEYSISYSHGYCPVRIGDCVRLNCPKAGLNNVKAKVISQSIKCEPGCPVSEKAVFTTKLWR